MRIKIVAAVTASVNEEMFLKLFHSYSHLVPAYIERKVDLDFAGWLLIIRDSLLDTA